VSEEESEQPFIHWLANAPTYLLQRTPQKSAQATGRTRTAESKAAKSRRTALESEKNMMEQLVEESEHDLANRAGAHTRASVSRKRERGAILVELLIALTVVAVLAAMAAPSIVGLQMAANNTYAWNTVTSVYFTGKALAVCNAYQNSCPQLVMPSDGTWQQAGYTFTFSSTGGGGTGGGGGDAGGSATLPVGVTLASLKLQAGGGGGGSGSGGGGTSGSGSFSWTFTATPIVYGVTGIHSYSASLSGIVQTN
jgi:Prokaryotic N-terminal methylation motif